MQNLKTEAERLVDAIAKAFGIDTTADLTQAQYDAAYEIALAALEAVEEM
jgi:hypothetical protein